MLGFKLIYVSEMAPWLKNGAKALPAMVLHKLSWGVTIINFCNKFAIREYNVDIVCNPKLGIFKTNRLYHPFRGRDLLEYIDEFVPEKRNSIANTLELPSSLH